jgi:hypothetical protein
MDRKDVFVGPLTFPLELFADLGRAVTRAPMVWLYQIERDVQSTAASQLIMTQGRGAQAWVKHPRLKDANEMYVALRDRYDEAEGCSEIEIGIMEEHVSRRQALARFGMYVLTFPLKLGLSPLIDGLGMPAWDNMSRRTLMMFEGPTLNPPRDGKERLAKDVLDHTPGAVKYFADRLRAHVNDHTDPARPYEITVVGHSMGTMVMNEFLRRNMDLPYRHVVYMGAACTVRDFARSVVPLLEANCCVEFHSL